MDVFILRAKPHGRDRETDFLNGRISIGWPCGKNFDGASREYISNALSARSDSITKISISMVEIFVEMKIGSIVLTPSPKQSIIHIFETTSKYKYDKDKDNDEEGNPHYIEVKFIISVPRDEIPSPVKRSLSGAKKTISRISQHSSTVSDYIKSSLKGDSEAPQVSEQGHVDAINVLRELLRSEDENIRLQAAITITNLPSDL